MRRALGLLSCWLLVAVGCGKGLPLSLGDAPATSASAAPLGPPVFLEDDYPRAREEALRRELPLVVFAWSPWCTDCLGLRSYVFNDPALTCIGTRFVWLALDVDDPRNAIFWERFPVERTPTLWIVEPERQRPVFIRNGPLTTPELLMILEDTEPRARPRPSPIPLASSGAPEAPRPPITCPGAASASAAPEASSASAPPASSSSSAPPPPPPPPPLSPEQIAERRAQERLLEAELAEFSSGSLGGAEHAFQEALQAPRRWSRRPRAVDGLHSLLARRASRRCVEFAAQELPSLPPGTFAASVARRALQCARREDDKGTADATMAAASALEFIARNPSQPLLPSYRSNLYEDLIRHHKHAGDKERALRLTREWLGFLETEAILARTGEQRRVFDDHKQRAHLELGTPAEALPSVARTAAEFPDDYTAHARLARVLVDLKRWPEALEQADRALAGARGQGVPRLVLLKAEVLDRLRRRDEARELLKKTLEQLERSPLVINHERQVKELRQRLAALPER